jgi:hypothetical protein
LRANTGVIDVLNNLVLKATTGFQIHSRRVATLVADALQVTRIIASSFTSANKSNQRFPSTGHTLSLTHMLFHRGSSPHSASHVTRTNVAYKLVVVSNYAKALK